MNRKVILLMLLTVFLTFSVQSVSHGFFWEIIGAIGEALGAVGEAIGGTVGAIGTVLGLIVDVIADTVVIAADATHLSIRLIATAVWDTDSVSNAFSFPDGGLLGAVVSNLIYLWDPHTGQLQGTLVHDTPIRNVAVNPDGSILASGSMDGTIRLWNPYTGKLQTALSGDTAGGIWSVAFSPDGSLLASGSADGTIQLWNPHAETLQATISGYTNSGVLSVAFSPDGTLLASGSVDGTIRLWDPNIRNLQTTIRAHTDSVLSIAFSPDGSLLASTSADGTVGLWRSRTGQNRAMLDHQAPVLSIAFNPDGSMFTSGSVDGTARLWDPETGKILATLGHESPVRSVTFSPDGSMLITGSEDGKARQWQITIDPGSTTTSTLTPKRGTPFTGTPASVSASTVAPLTEKNLHESVVTLTLSEWSFEHSTFDIRDAVTVSGIDGVTIPWHQPDRKNDTEITIELEFDGDFDTDSTLTFTVGPGAIANYNGPTATVQIPVPAVTELIVATAVAPLAETTLDESVVTLTLTGRNYVRSSFTIERALTVSGIEGVTIPWHQPDRKNDTEITIELEFDGDIDSDSTLTFTLGAGAIVGYNGPPLTAEVPVTGTQESVTASTAAPLTEATLDESVVTLTLSGRKYASSIFDIRDAVSISGIDGVTMPWHQPRRKSDTQLTVELEFNGNMNTDGTLTFTLGADAIAGYNGPALTAEIPVTGKQEALAASTQVPLTEVTLDESVVTLTLTGGDYVRSSFDIERAVTISGIDGVTVDDVDRISNTKVAVELEFNGDFDADATLTFNVGANAIANYNGPTLTAEIPVTGAQESVVATTAAPLTEATLNESVVTLTLSGRKYARSIFDIRDAVSVSGIDGVTMPWHDPDRKNDTQLTIELAFDGDIDTNATLTFTVDADAIANYNGPTFTAEIPVTGAQESVVATTTAPLKEATLDGSVVTLTLSGRKFARSIFDIRDAVSVSGITGVTIPWHQPRRKSDTQITIELEFDGNINADGTLTFTVGADAIANYNGSELTAQVTVTADRENALLANFPNPFNPETWIPYQLAKPTEVTITIYNIKGYVVRTLEIGHQPAGTYQTRSGAAYWDGRNAFGEPVASGVYFYTLSTESTRDSVTADNFTATRKMLIRK